MKDIIGIALATYNGSKHVEVMLDSIHAQTFKLFHVHLCDDGSKDNTLDIIKSTKLYKEGRVTLHEVSGGFGAMANFRRAISYCDENYIVLCDQDDYWDPYKLEIMVERMQSLEKNHDTPILVFSDLEIVNKGLETMFKSFFRASSKNSSCSNPEDFVINNHVPGCAMMFNNISRQYFEKIPDNVRMHDWWIIFIVSLYGVIDYIDVPLIKYRQHDNNTVGVPGIYSKNSSITKLKELKGFLFHLKKSKLMLGLVLDWVYSHPELKLNISGQHFVKKIDKGFLGRMSLLKRSCIGGNLIISILIWCFL